MGNCEISRSWHSLIRILKIYIEALTGFSYMYSPDGLKNTLLKAKSLEILVFRKGKGMHILRTEQVVRRSPPLHGPGLGSTCHHVFSKTSSKRQ